MMLQSATPITSSPLPLQFYAVNSVTSYLKFYYSDFCYDCADEQWLWL